MKDPNDRLIYESGLAFFGRLTAGVSHEMKNILSILGELGGLLEDLSESAQQGKGVPGERVRPIAERIGRAVARGDDQLKRLRHFAHSADDSRAARNLDEVVTEIVGLCQRLSILKKARLTVESPGGTPVTVVGVFSWYHLLYECIRIALEDAQPEDTVTVRVESQGPTARIRIAASGGFRRDAMAKQAHLLAALAEELRVRIEPPGEGARESPLTIHLPARS